MISSNSPKLRLDEPVQIKNINIFYQETDGGSKWVSAVSPDIRELFGKISSHFERAHAIKATKVRTRTLFHTYQADQLSPIHNGFLGIVKTIYQKWAHVVREYESALRTHIWRSTGQPQRPNQPLVGAVQVGIWKIQPLVYCIGYLPC